MALFELILFSLFSYILFPLLDSGEFQLIFFGMVVYFVSGADFQGREGKELDHKKSVFLLCVLSVVAFISKEFNFLSLLNILIYGTLITIQLKKTKNKRGQILKILIYMFVIFYNQWTIANFELLGSGEFLLSFIALPFSYFIYSLFNSNYDNQSLYYWLNSLLVVLLCSVPYFEYIGALYFSSDILPIISILIVCSVGALATARYMLNNESQLQGLGVILFSFCMLEMHILGLKENLPLYYLAIAVFFVRLHSIPSSISGLNLQIFSQILCFTTALYFLIEQAGVTSVHLIFLLFGLALSLLVTSKPLAKANYPTKDKWMLSSLLRLSGTIVFGAMYIGGYL